MRYDVSLSSCTVVELFVIKSPSCHISHSAFHKLAVSVGRLEILLLYVRNERKKKRHVVFGLVSCL